MNLFKDKYKRRAALGTFLIHLTLVFLFYSFGSSNSYEINNGSKIKLTCKKRSKQSEINAISYSNNLKP